eukprot:Em0004g282a
MRRNIAFYASGGSPASAGLDTTCQEKILSSLQSLQDQIAELRSSTATSSTAATAPEPPKEKRIAKELSSAIHSTVKHLRDQTENAMEWNTSLSFTDIANRRVTDEVATACQSDKFPAAVVRKAARIYFASLKRRSKMVLAGKLDESKKRQRKVQRKHNKAHSRMNACTTSTAITAEEKNEATKILTVDFMSSEETGRRQLGAIMNGCHQLPFSNFVHFLGGATGRIPLSPAWTERPSAGAQIEQRRCAASGTMAIRQLGNRYHLLLRGP